MFPRGASPLTLHLTCAPTQSQTCGDGPILSWAVEAADAEGRGWGEGRGEAGGGESVQCGQSSFWEDEEVLERMMVMVTRQCECA